VVSDKDREHYLGHSVLAPAGESSSLPLSSNEGKGRKEEGFRSPSTPSLSFSLISVPQVDGRRLVSVSLLLGLSLSSAEQSFDARLVELKLAKRRC